MHLQISNYIFIPIKCPKTFTYVTNYPYSINCYPWQFSILFWSRKAFLTFIKWEEGQIYIISYKVTYVTKGASSNFTKGKMRMLSLIISFGIILLYTTYYLFLKCSLFSLRNPKYQGNGDNANLNLHHGWDQLKPWRTFLGSNCPLQ